MFHRLSSISLLIALLVNPPLALAGRASDVEAARNAYWEGRFEASLAELSRLLPSLTGKEARRDAYFFIGLNQLALGKKAEAREAWKEAARTDPDFMPSEEIYSPDVVSAYREARPAAPASEEERNPPPRAASSKTNIPATRFEKIKLMVTAGDETKEAEAVLSLDDGVLAVRSKKEAALLKEFAYDDIKAAQYSYSTHPRWKEGAGFAVAVGVLATPIFFMKGKKHWLTIQTADDFALLRLDKNNYQMVILALETRAGLEVETSEGEN